MRYLSLDEVVEIYHQVMAQSGGLVGIRDIGLLESALSQPLMTFGGQSLYPTLIEKASALGFGLIKNHPFLDGNKRIGHASMEVFLVLNGYEIKAGIDEQEKIILDVAAGNLNREEFTVWLQGCVIKSNM